MDKYTGVKDKTYKENHFLISVVCVCIIVFIIASIVWMVTDFDFLLAIDVMCLLIIAVDFIIIIRRRKKGIYLITDEEYEEIEKEMMQKKKGKEIRKGPKRLK